MPILEWASHEANVREMTEIRRIYRCTPIEAALLLMLGQVAEGVDGLGSLLPMVVVEPGESDEEDEGDE